MDTFSIEVNYGGYFKKEDTLCYVGGQQQIVDNIDGDKMSFFEVVDILTEIGFGNWKKIQYLDPSFQLHHKNGLKSICSGLDVVVMVSSLTEAKYVKLYVVHDDVEQEAFGDHGGDEDVESSVNEDENMELTVTCLSPRPNYSEEERSEGGTKYKSTVTDVELGMKFSSLKEIKEVVADYAVQNGHDIKFVKNEKVRLTATCQGVCKWRLHASKMQNESTYQIKSYNNVHTCARRMEVRHATASWIVKKYQQKFKSQPDWQLSSIVETVRQDFNVNINLSLHIEQDAKQKKLNEGCRIEQYKQLRSYAEEIRQTNPGSTFKISLEMMDDRSKPTFQRAYVCYKACTDELLAGGRPILCLDVCHLKGECPSHLLTAVEIDGDDDIYPIAIAVVESEIWICVKLWMWFGMVF